MLIVAGTVLGGGSADAIAQDAATTARFRAAGLRPIAGRHLTLWTDLPPRTSGGAIGDVDDIPAVFDAAVPAWCEAIGVPVGRADGWHLTGFLMADARRFTACGAFPTDLPPFPHGYQRGDSLWIYEQPSPDYRRHLVLHEGVHGLMKDLLGGIGPPWYAEGMAERLATHRLVAVPADRLAEAGWADSGEPEAEPVGRPAVGDGWLVATGIVPPSREGFEMWGRIKIIRDDFAARRALRPEAIMAFGPQAHRDVRAYAWSWALCTFLAAHPATEATFRTLPTAVTSGAEDFAGRIVAEVGADWPRVGEDWQVFIKDLDYGYDVDRAIVRRRPTRPLAPGATEIVAVAADAGWQSTGLTIPDGSRLRVTATGFATVSVDPIPWRATATGVTLGYADGLPVGRLLLVVRDEVRTASGATPFLRPVDAGAAASPGGAEMRAAAGGTVFLKINDAASALSDNAGSLSVRLELLSGGVTAP